MKRTTVDNLLVNGGEYENYNQLSDDELTKRLSEERDRAKAMDEKTFKMTLALTVGLTVLGTTATAIVQGIPFVSLRPFVGIFTWIAVMYSLAGGFVALGALRTLPSFGYGTMFTLEAKRDRIKIPEALVAQELMNIVRHLRNEAAYQCLRNGILCLFMAVILYETAVVADSLGLKQAFTRRRQDIKTQAKIVTPTIAPDTIIATNNPSTPSSCPPKNECPTDDEHHR